MLSILRAEFRRLLSHRGIHILILLAIGFYAADVAVKTIYVMNEPRERALDAFAESLSFPILLFTVIGTSFVMFLFLWPAFTAKVVGGDYEADTWKMILPRTPERGRILAGKLVVLIAIVCFLLVVDLIFLTIGAMVAGAQFDIPVVAASTFTLRQEHKEIAAEFFAFVLWYTSVGTLFTVLARSVFTGAFATLSFYFVCVFIRTYSPEMISMLFAPSHFTNLIPAEESAVVFGGGNRLHLSPAISWIVVLAHIVGNIAFSYFWLRRQDFDSSR